MPGSQIVVFRAGGVPVCGKAHTNAATQDLIRPMPPTGYLPWGPSLSVHSDVGSSSGEAPPVEDVFLREGMAVGIDAETPEAVIGAGSAFREEAPAGVIAEDGRVGSGEAEVSGLVEGGDDAVGKVVEPVAYVRGHGGHVPAGDYGAVEKEIVVGKGFHEVEQPVAYRVVRIAIRIGSGAVMCIVGAVAVIAITVVRHDGGEDVGILADGGDVSRGLKSLQQGVIHVRGNAVGIAVGIGGRVGIGIPVGIPVGREGEGEEMGIGDGAGEVGHPFGDGTVLCERPGIGVGIFRTFRAGFTVRTRGEGDGDDVRAEAEMPSGVGVGEGAHAQSVCRDEHVGVLTVGGGGDCPEDGAVEAHAAVVDAGVSLLCELGHPAVDRHAQEAVVEGDDVLLGKGVDGIHEDLGVFLAGVVEVDEVVFGHIDEGGGAVVHGKEGKVGDQRASVGRGEAVVLCGDEGEGEPELLRDEEGVEGVEAFAEQERGVRIAVHVGVLPGDAGVVKVSQRGAFPFGASHVEHGLGVVGYLAAGEDVASAMGHEAGVVLPA